MGDTDVSQSGSTALREVRWGGGISYPSDNSSRICSRQSYSFGLTMRQRCATAHGGALAVGGGMAGHSFLVSFVCYYSWRFSLLISAKQMQNVKS